MPLDAETISNNTLRSMLLVDAEQASKYMLQTDTEVHSYTPRCSMLIDAEQASDKVLCGVLLM